MGYSIKIHIDMDKEEYLSMKKLLFVLFALLSASLFAQMMDDAEIGTTVTMETEVVNVTVNDVWEESGKIVVPAGFEIVSAEPIIYSEDEGQFSITSITQPDSIAVPEEAIAAIQSAVADFENVDLRSVQNDLALLFVALAIVSVNDATTHGEINWTAQAEGHVLGGEGHIRAGVQYTLIRRASTKDYRKILLELAQLGSNATTRQLQPILNQIIALVR